MYILTNTTPQSIINLMNCISVDIDEKENVLYAVGNNGERYTLHSFESESIIDAIRLIYKHLSDGCNALDMKDFVEELPPAPPRKKEPSKRLIVTLKDGREIEKGNQTLTFIDAIEIAGIDKVYTLELQSKDYPLIKRKNTDDHPGRNRASDSTGYYSIRTVYSADGKKEILDTIGEKLSTGWSVSVLPGEK
ncbi:hypothetical protein JT359_09930 [Candidatus Poribacteria bacterium]|nr:hypothetical protein [Candidatus Poribacteria bacterium]